MVTIRASARTYYSPREITMLSKLSRELTVFGVIGLTIGLIMTIVSNLFVIGVEYGRTFRNGLSYFDIQIGSGTHSLAPFLTLVLAALATIWLKKVMKIKAWAGPADSIYAAHNPTKELDLKLGYASTAVAFICASGGASVGQYGPLVHFGATVGASFKRLLNSGLGQDVWLGCGVAAAISAGFNAPLAGVIFAHEAILRHFSLRAIAPIFIASVSANTFDHLLFPGAQAIFVVDEAAPEIQSVVPYLVIFAPALAVIAMSFMSTIRALQKISEKLNKTPVPSQLYAALFVGAIGFFLPEVLGIGGFAINNIFSGEYSLQMLFLLLFSKFIATALCLGLGLFGGIFSPSLFLGVTAGAIFGQLLIMAGLPQLSDALSIAGMAAVSAAIVGAPISCIIIVMELTRSYEYSVISMLAVIVCSLLCHRMNNGSFFDRQLLNRGIDILSGRDAILLAETCIKNFVSLKPLILKRDTTGLEAIALMETKRLTEAYVCDDVGHLLGKVTMYSAKEAASESIYLFMNQYPLSITDEDSLAVAMNKASNFVGESIPVVNNQNILLGAMTEGELFKLVLRVQRDARAIEIT